jgi:RNA polymerase sigma-70 factor (ECF subfamily)
LDKPEKPTAPLHQIETVEHLFKAHYAMVCSTIHRLLKDKVKTEDVAQEMFAELWQKRDQLHIHTSEAAYLRRMAVSRALNYIRDSRRHNWDTLDDPESPLSGPTVLPEVISSMEEAELRARLERAIGELPEKCRIVFLLSRVEELSYAEIAEQLGISAKTVENQIGKALKLLRLAIAGDGG